VTTIVGFGEIRIHTETATFELRSPGLFVSRCHYPRLRAETTQELEAM